VRLRLNGWQRLWAVTSGLLILPFALILVYSWPDRDSQVVADLGAEECRAWRELPEGFFPAGQLLDGEPCSSLVTYISSRQVPVREISDYERVRTAEAVQASAIVAGSWLAVILVFYGAGLAVGWVVRGFRGT
jgi:hypothetical protein